MERTAKLLQEQLSLPPPHAAGSWVPSQGRQYHVSHLWTGTWEGIPLRWEPLRRSRGQLRLDVEDEEGFVGLKAHIPDEALWDSLDRWKVAGAEYLFACQRLVREIVRECQRCTSSSLLISQQWPRKGIFWDFAAQIYIHETEVAAGLSGLATFDYEVQGPNRCLLYELWHGSGGIGCHRSQRQLTSWRIIHSTFLGSQTWNRTAISLVRKHRVPEDLGGPIKKRLRSEIERGTFDGGRCSNCPQFEHGKRSGRI